jgi:metal-responsive CopG/Arc/MetJ family transcriptional regulator
MEGKRGMFQAMQARKAHVENGRIVLDGHTTLPEGACLEVVVVDGDDDLDEEERARLHAALAEGVAQSLAGQVVPAEELIRRLMSR